MKKQNKNVKRPLLARLIGTPHRALITGLVSAAMLTGVYSLYTFIWHIAYNHRAVTELSAAEQARELIVRSVDNMMRDVPVEARSGDLYIPEGRLTLPRPAEVVALSYYVDKSSGGEVYGIVNRVVYERQVSKVMSTRTVKEVFQHAPKLQACARGVVLSQERRNPEAIPDPVHKGVVGLAGGKQLHMYIDKGCLENDATAELLQSVKSY